MKAWGFGLLVQKSEDPVMPMILLEPFYPSILFLQSCFKCFEFESLFYFYSLLISEQAILVFLKLDFYSSSLKN